MQRETMFQVTPPAVEAVTTADVLAHLRLEAEQTDTADVAAKIGEAVGWLDGRDGILGRALITQTWCLVLDRFPRGAITLPLPPLQLVESIAYTQPGGSTATLPLSDYVVAGIGTNDPARILPARDKAWPATDDYPEAVRITFRAGYGAAPEDVPAPLRGAIKMLAAHLYENRETAVIGTIVADLPLGFSDAVSPYRLWSF